MTRFVIERAIGPSSRLTMWRSRRVTSGCPAGGTCSPRRKRPGGRHCSALRRSLTTGRCDGLLRAEQKLAQRG